MLANIGGIEAIILDRDGVINYDSPNYIKSADEWIPIESSIHAIVSLKLMGIRLFIATNQSGIGRGYYQLEDLHAMHVKMNWIIEQQAKNMGCLENVTFSDSEIYFCPHTPDDDCNCRKPRPQMLNEIIADHNLDIEKTCLIGDAKRDLEAALRVNISPILVRTGKGQQTESDNSDWLDRHHIPTFDDLNTITALLQSR